MKYFSSCLSAVLLTWCCFAAQAQSGAPAWQMAMKLISPSATANTTATDVEGNVYIAGGFSGTIQLGPATLTSAGSYDIYIAKWSPATNSFVWAERAGGVEDDRGGELAVSGSNVYLISSCSSPTVSFGAGDPVAIPLNGSSGLLVTKLTDAGSSGSFVWAQGTPDAHASLAGSIAVEGTSVYLTGSFSQTANFGGVALTSAGGSDIFVAKLSDSGPSASYTWARRVGGTGNEYAGKLAVEGSTVYVSGDYDSPEVIVGSSKLTSPGTPALLVGKLIDAGPSAEFIWGQSAEGRSGGSGYQNGIRALVAHGGNVYVAGYFLNSNLKFDNNFTLINTGTGYDAFVAKLTDAGTGGGAFAWVQQIAGEGHTDASSLAVTSDGVYLAGSFENTVRIGGTVLNSDAPTNPTGSNTDLFVARFIDDALAVRLAWVQRGGGAEYETSSAISVSGSQVFVVGTLTGDAHFGDLIVPVSTTGKIKIALFAALGVGTSQPSPITPATPAWKAALPVGASLLRATAVDTQGNVLVAGAFQGTMRLGSTTLTSVGDYDIFVAKWSPASQDFVWAQRAGGAGFEQAMAVAVTSAGVYVTGQFISSTATFGSTSLTNASSSNSDVFVAKLTDAGSTASFAWAQRAGGAGYEIATAVAADGSNVFLAGSFSGTSASFGSTVLTGESENAVFIAKLRDEGTAASFTWAQQAGGAAGSGYPYAQALAVSGNNVYIAGSFSGVVGFGSTSLTGMGPNTADIFVARLTDAGSTASFAWARQAGGTSEDAATALAVNGANVYLAGYFKSSTAQFGDVILSSDPTSSANTSDLFVAKLTDSGSASTFSWAQRAGGAGEDRAQALAVMGTNVYVAGYFESRTAVFGSASLTTSGAPSDSDIFVARLSDAGNKGNFLWAQRAGGSGADQATALGVQGPNVYVGGLISPPADFGGQTVSGPTGGQRGFLASLSEATVLATAKQGHIDHVSLYPNPAHATAFVRVQGQPGEASPVKLTLINGLGKRVRSQSYSLSAAAWPYPLDLTGLVPGMYILQVQVGAALSVRQLLID
jgi:hypothetical protein